MLLIYEAGVVILKGISLHGGEVRVYLSHQSGEVLETVEHH